MMNNWDVLTDARSASFPESNVTSDRSAAAVFCVDWMSTNVFRLLLW